MLMVADTHTHMCRMKRATCAHQTFTFTSSNMEICQTQSHASTETPNTQSRVTDSAGTLSSADNCYHHCAALQWVGYPRSLMFVFMYICFEGGRHKKLNPAQNKEQGDRASPTDIFQGGKHRDKWLFLCVYVCIRDGCFSSQKPQDAFCQNRVTSLSKIL